MRSKFSRMLARGKSPSFVSPPEPASSKKWFPGHYVGKFGVRTTMHDESRALAAGNQYITGYRLTLTWALLEPEPGVYRFDLVQDMCDLAASDGKTVHIFILERTQSTVNASLPAWLAQYDGGWWYKADNGVTIMQYWNPDVLARWISFLGEFGDACDSIPNLAVITLPETSPTTAGDSFPPEKTEENMVGFFASQFAAFRDHFPTTVMCQYANWGGTSVTRAQMIQDAEDAGCGMGGPDIWSRIKPGTDGQCILNAYGSLFYLPKMNDIPVLVENQGSGYEGGTAREQFEFAVDTVGLNFASWTYQDDPLDAYTIHDVARVITEERGRINTTIPSNLLVAV